MTQATQPNDYAAQREKGPEAPFDYQELVYSRTDDRGVILAANDVFERLSGHAYADLIGAPHKIIRHPDMPSGFFHLFWQYLKAGEPAVGYVKNRSKDGSYYWVLAAAIPGEGGYYSVRMKPGSALFQAVRTEYARLRKREEAEGLSPEASAEALRARLRELGFLSFTDFMSQALQEELASRDTRLGRTPDKVVAHLTALGGSLSEALKEQTRLVGLFDSLKLLPVNMRLIAARLEPQGGPISQISMNYKTSFDNISERLTKFVTGKGNICAKMDVAVRRGLILTNCTRLHGELSQQLRQPDPDFSGEDRRQEHRVVDRLAQDAQKQVHESLGDAAQLAAALIGSAYEVRRLVLGLDTIRILGRVESRRDPASEAACSATLDQIDSVQAEISQSLQRLSNLAVAIQTSLSMITAARQPRGGAGARQTAARGASDPAPSRAAAPDRPGPRPAKGEDADALAAAMRPRAGRTYAAE